MSQSRENSHCVQSRDTSKSHYATKPLDDSYEEDDLVNNVVSLLPVPVKQEELPASPLFTQLGSNVGSPTVYGFSPAGTNEVLALESPFHMGQSPSTALSPTTEDFPVAGSSTYLHAPAPISSGGLSGWFYPGDADSSPLNEVSHHNLTPCPDNFQYWPRQGMFSDTFPTEIDGLGPPTAVPRTPTTGYHTAGLVTPGNIPAVYAQDLPTGLNNSMFGFAGTEASVQPTCDFSSYFNCTEQASPFTAQTFFNAAPAPAPAPVPTPAPKFPTPVHTGQFNQNIGSQDDVQTWHKIGQIIESDGPAALPPPVPPQNAPLTTAQDTPPATFQNTPSATFQNTPPAPVQNISISQTIHYNGSNCTGPVDGTARFGGSAVQIYIGGKPHA
jgi:hypothetical protein